MTTTKTRVSLDPDRHSGVDGSGHPAGPSYDVLDLDDLSRGNRAPPAGRALELRYVAQSCRDLDDVVPAGLPVGGDIFRAARTRGREALRDLPGLISEARAHFRDLQRRCPGLYDERRLMLAVRALEPLGRAARDRSPVDAALVHLWLAQFAGRTIARPSGETFTVLGASIDDVPETASRPVTLAHLLVAESGGKAVPRAHRGLFGTKPTTRPRAMLATWLASNEPDVQNAREALAADARRLGAAIVIAVRGSMPPPPVQSVADEVAELRRRLDELVGVSAPPAAAAVDRSRIFNLGGEP